MIICLEIKDITKDKAEKMIGRFAEILGDDGHKVTKMEISESVKTEYKLKDDTLWEETFFTHKLVKR